jgi:hypothetical protein
MDLKGLKLTKECVGIINQLYDLAEVPVEKRQAINDEADKYLLDQVLRLSDVSQERELLLGFQKSEYFDLYEQGVLEYKDAIEKYLA